MSINSLISLVGGAYADLLMDATYGGFPFQVLNLKTEDGRRIQRFLFPGQDRIAYQDLGQDDGNIAITALLIGDDFVHQAERFRSVFQAPGPKVLDHPFFDSAFLVVPASKLEVTHDAQEIRIARLSFQVSRCLPRVAAPPDTLQGILDAIADLKAAARAWLRQVLRPLGLALAVVSTVRQFALTAAGVWDQIATSSGDSQVAASIATPTAGLTRISALKLDASYGDSVTTALAAPSAAIAAVALPQQTAAVAPGGSTDAPIAADPRIAAGVILSAVAALAPANPLARGAQAALAAQAMALGDAVDVASDIPFTSQQDALSWQARLTAALDATGALAAQAAALDPQFAGPVWRALMALRAALIADMSQRLGRLPSVQVLHNPAMTSAWLLAQHLSADRPDQMLAVYLDIVARNDVAQPALVPAGALEVLG